MTDFQLAPSEQAEPPNITAFHYLKHFSLLPELDLGWEKNSSGNRKQQCKELESSGFLSPHYLLHFLPEPDLTFYFINRDVHKTHGSPTIMPNLPVLYLQLSCFWYPYPFTHPINLQAITHSVNHFQKLCFWRQNTM